MPKDREAVIPLAADAEIMYRRSSDHPVEYAIMLRVRRGDRWETVISADNSHQDLHVDVHHFHLYSDGEQQEAESLPFPVAGVNDAMHKIIRWFADEWRELAS